MVLESFAPKPSEAYHQSRGPDGPWKFSIQTKDSAGGTGSTIQVQFQWTHFDIALRQLPRKNYLGERCLKPLYCRNLMPQAYFYASKELLQVGCLAPRYLKIAGPKPRKSAVYIEGPKISVKARTAATTEISWPSYSKNCSTEIFGPMKPKTLAATEIFGQTIPDKKKWKRGIVFAYQKSWAKKNEGECFFRLMSHLVT